MEYVESSLNGNKFKGYTNASKCKRAVHFCSKHPMWKELKRDVVSSAQWSSSWLLLYDTRNLAGKSSYLKPVILPFFPDGVQTD